MFQSAQKGFIQNIAPYSLHGTIYYNITFTDSDGKLQNAKLSSDAVYQNPQSGDNVLVHYLLNSVTHIEKVKQE